MKKIVLVTVFISVIIFSFCPYLVFAQESQTSNVPDSKGIVVSPQYYIGKLKSGTKLNGEFFVTNQGSRRDLIIATRSIIIDQNGEPQALTDESIQLEKDKFLSYGPKNFSLSKGETQKITFNLDIPIDTPTRALNFQFVVKEDFQKISPSTPTTAITFEVVYPMAINITGKEAEVRDVTIDSFYTDKPFYEYTPVKFFAKIYNKGNINSFIKGEIFISSDEKFTPGNIDTIKLADQGRVVYYSSARTFDTTWNNSTLYYDENGVFKIDTKDISRIRIGKYFAQLTLIYEGLNGAPMVKNMVTSFWIIPWKILLAILVIFIIILFIIYRKVIGKRKRKSRNN